MSVITITGARMRNAHVLANKIASAFEEWAWTDVNLDYWNEQFKTPIWSYAGKDVTIRRSDRALIKEADSPRDIYDYGELYESGVNSCSVNLSPNLAVASWKWDAKNSSGQAYAWYVHEGRGSNESPRRWTDELYDPQKFDTSMIKQKLLRRIRAALSSL